MSVEIRIDSYDISDMEERLDRAFDIRNGWGAEAVTDDNVMASFDEVGHGYPLGSVQAVLQQQQATIADQQREINKLFLMTRKMQRELNQVTDALDSAGKNFFKIGMKSQEIK